MTHDIDFTALIKEHHLNLLQAKWDEDDDDDDDDLGIPFIFFFKDNSDLQFGYITFGSLDNFPTLGLFPNPVERENFLKVSKEYWIENFRDRNYFEIGFNFL